MLILSQKYTVTAPDGVPIDVADTICDDMEDVLMEMEEIFNAAVADIGVTHGVALTTEVIDL